MKILIEIPNKFVEIVKGIMLGTCRNEDDEKELYETVDIALSAEDPILTDSNRLLAENREERAKYSQLMLSLAALALAQIKQEQIEELQRKKTHPSA